MNHVFPSDWVLLSPPEKPCEKLKEACGISLFAARLLWNRNLRTPEQVRAFLACENDHIPPSEGLPDLSEAVSRLIQAIQNQEKVLVFGDYDVDGITSTVLLYSYLKKEGARPSYYIPTRSGEGYGLNTDVIERFAKEGVSLLVTVDCGVTAFEEVKFCNSLGVDVIVTDHHRCRKTLPPAKAVVNPMREDSNYPFRGLAGVGVVFKLLCALHEALHKLPFSQASDEIAERYIDLVAIGTVADVMPLTGENRLFVIRGLKAIPKTENVGLSALLHEIYPAPSIKPVKYNAGTIGFLIAPRINAAGRIGSAMRAVELFLTEDERKAASLAVELCEENKRRQVAETIIYEEAISEIESCEASQSDFFILVENERWHQGVVGIVASRLCEQFHRPCILFSYPDGPNGPAKGSGRSIKGINLVEALSGCEGLLLKYGGHELAAGVTVQRDNLPLLQKALNEYAEAQLQKMDLSFTKEIDFCLDEADITVENALDIMHLEPFGMKNAKPLFLVKNALVHSIHPIGDGKHSKLSLNIKRAQFNALYFNQPPDQVPALRGEWVDLLCTLDINTYMEKTAVQLCVKEIRPAEKLMLVMNQELERYETYKNLTAELQAPLTRKEFEMIFRQLKGICRQSQADLFFFSRKLGLDFSKLLLALDIFEEAGLIRRTGDCKFTFPRILLLPIQSAKVSLENTKTFRLITNER